MSVGGVTGVAAALDIAGVVADVTSSFAIANLDSPNAARLPAAAAIEFRLVIRFDMAVIQFFLVNMEHWSIQNTGEPGHRMMFSQNNVLSRIVNSQKQCAE